MIARILAEKDILRSQLVELQEKLFSLKAVHNSRERRQSADVNLNAVTYQHTQYSGYNIKFF